MPNAYLLGNLARVSAAFATAAGTATDPTTVTCTVVEADGTRATYTYGTDAEVVKDTTGQYHLDLLIDTAGRWHYRWEGIGACTAAGEGTLYGLLSRVL